MGYLHNSPTRRPDNPTGYRGIVDDDALEDPQRQPELPPPATPNRLKRALQELAQNHVTSTGSPYLTKHGSVTHEPSREPTGGEEPVSMRAPPAKLIKRSNFSESTVNAVSNGAEQRKYKGPDPTKSVKFHREEALAREVGTLRKKIKEKDDVVVALRRELHRLQVTQMQAPTIAECQRLERENAEMQDNMLKMQSQLQLVTSKNSELETKVKDCTAEVKKCQSKTTELAMALDRERQAFESSENANIVTQREIEALKSQLSTSEQSYRSLVEQYESLRSSLASKNSEIETMKAREEEGVRTLTESLNQRMATLQDDVTAKQTQIIELMASKASLEQAKSQLETRYETALENLERAQQTYLQQQADHEHYVRELKADFNLQQTQVKSQFEDQLAYLQSNTQTETADLKQQLEAERATARQLQTAGNDAETQIRQLSGEKSAAEQKLATADRTVADQEQRISALHGDYTRLNESYAQLQAEARRMAQDKAGLQHKLRELDLLVDAHVHEIGSLKATIAEYENHKSMLSVALNAEKSNCEELAQEVKRIEQARQALETNLKSADRHNSSLSRDMQAQVGLLSEELKIANQSIAALHGKLAETHGLKEMAAAYKEQLQKLEEGGQADGVMVAELTAQNKQYKTKLAAEQKLVRSLQNQIQDLKGTIRIVARIRPPMDGTVATDDTVGLLKLTASNVTLNEPESTVTGAMRIKSFPVKYDRVFGPMATNSQVSEEADYLVESALEGRQVCIFAYGQTGSGKTWTMSGADGINLFALSKMMNRVNSTDNPNCFYHIEVEAVEIYVEQLHDLLRPNERNGIASSTTRSYGTAGSNTSVFSGTNSGGLSIQVNPTTGQPSLAGAQRIAVHSMEEAVAAMEKATKNRSTAATAANERSSRSHFIFSVHIGCTYNGESGSPSSQTHGVLHLVDLAGSERLAQSQTTGDRLKETQAINKSLASLSNVIMALVSPTPPAHISYRDSKLTYMLQGSLSGNAKAMLVTALSPEQRSTEETKSTMRFAEKASRAKIR